MHKDNVKENYRADGMGVVYVILALSFVTGTQTLHREEPKISKFDNFKTLSIQHYWSQNLKNLIGHFLYSVKGKIRSNPGFGTSTKF